MGREPRGRGDDTPDEAQAAPIQFSLRERLQLTAGLAESGHLDGVDGDYGN
jgi:hypothetical protein